MNTFIRVDGFGGIFYLPINSIAFEVKLSTTGVEHTKYYVRVLPDSFQIEVPEVIFHNLLKKVQVI